MSEDIEVAKKIAAYYEQQLEARLEQETDPINQYRLQAELEDIEDGHWNGPRLDSPPASWHGWPVEVKAKAMEQILRSIVAKMAQYALGAGLSRVKASSVLVEVAQWIETTDDNECPPLKMFKETK